MTPRARATRLTEDRDTGADHGPAELSAEEFRQLFAAVSNWGRWGEDDERGAINDLTPDRVAAAARLVRSGETVTLSHPLNTRPGIDNPEPADHHMTMLPDVDVGSGALRFAKDYIGIDYHNPPHSHIDALCHVAFDGALYNGKPSTSVTPTGAASDAIDVLKDGLIGRGVLLDVPRLREVRWLEPGEHVFPAELEDCERTQGVTVGRGDILLVRTGPRAPLLRSSGRGTRTRRRRGCIRPAPGSWPSAMSQPWGRTATTTRRPVRPRESTSRSTPWL